MKRGIVLGVLIAVGALSIGVSAAYQGQQQPAAPRIAAVDKLKDNLYLLRGGGGNTAVFIMTNGVAVVDAKNPGYGPLILDEIKKLTNKPVTLLINTHTHGDHVSGNVDFPGTVDIVVQENAKASMEKMDIFKNNEGKGLPKRTFKDKMTIGRGADQIDLFYFGPGHTNGDAWVSFPALRTVHAGDIFASKGMPIADPAAGGSVLHFADTLKKAHDGIKNADTIINGHLPAPTATGVPMTTTWADLQTYSEFMKEFATWAQAELKAGKSPADIAAAWKVPEKYLSQGYAATASANFGGLAARIQLLSDEIKK
jgi:glyoxylase-like metal-dependent hydrolase (beta-lactamase superfamily II)